MLIVTNSLIAIGAGFFGGDGLATMWTRWVSKVAPSDDLGEIVAYPGEGDAVKAFVPPEIFAGRRARDGGGVVRIC